MKILIITPRIPYPPYRGDKLKIYNLVKNLKRNNDVHIVTFLQNIGDKKDLDELQKRGFSIETIKHTKISSYIKLIKGFFSFLPFQILYYQSKKMKKRITELTTKEKYDVVYFSLINSAQYFNAVKTENTVKVIDFTDATSLYLKRYLEFIKNPIRKIFFKTELNRILKYEQIARNFNVLLICSEVDKKFLSDRKVHDNIQLLLNGFDLNTFNYEETKKEKGKIIFVGNMTYFPNIDAVKYFSEEIFPLISNELNYVKFYIVGQNPTKDILELQRENIIVKGFVEDLKYEYLSSEVNIAPIRFGSGTLNKLIEAIALGVPSVATSFAVQGFPLELKKFVHIKNTPQDFADEILSILKDDSNYKTKIAEGRSAISNMLSWEKVVGDFEIYLHNLISTN